MKSLLAFFKKEFTEQVRSGRLVILGALFVLFGIMNPAVAKLTPWLLELMADSLAQSGMTVTAVTVSAMDSWVQFFKNIPMALIAFVLLQSSCFTKEYASGTLVLSLTKGLERYKVVLAKSALLMLFWTVGYWLCFGITYGYTAYFWDPSVVQALAFAAFCWWLFGMLTVALTILFSVISTSNVGVLLGTGGVVLASYLLGLLPKFSKYLPTTLTDGYSLIYGVADAEEYVAATLIAAVAILLCLVGGLWLFNKKKL